VATRFPDSAESTSRPVRIELCARAISSQSRTVRDETCAHLCRVAPLHGSAPALFSKGRKNTMARHQPDQAQRKAVTVMIGLGAPPKIIADGLNIELETFERVYAKEIENGPASVKLELAKQLFNAARSDDGHGKVSAAVRLLDLLGGGDDQASSDRNTIKITGETRPVYFGGCGPPEFELFTREGERASWIYTTGKNDGV
jgi:hypothetical protein